MKDLKIPPLTDLFNTQEDVDKCVTETESLAEDVDDEESAIKLYKNVTLLKSVSEVFFVPDVILMWEEKALSYIESDMAMFQCVFYEQIIKTHERGFDALSSLEQHTLANLLSKKTFFDMVHSFNMDIKEFNEYCKKYHQKTFDYYKPTNNTLQQEYILWKNGGV